MNENYSHPAMPKGAETGILKGMYLLQEGKNKKDVTRPQLMGSGTILREVLDAARDATERLWYLIGCLVCH